MTKTAVIALGGNAFTLPGMAGTSDQLLSSAATMAAAVDEVIEAGWRVLIVHGNGPQVGNLALQQESTHMVPSQPLAVLGAMTQGQLGSVIARSIDELRGPGSAAALVTHVVVDRADPAFGAPTKPIGPFFDRGEAERLAAERGWQVRPDSGRGYRRVVASPQPTAIVETNAIRALLDSGLIVIAAGGGGIPVSGPSGDLGYADAVIDKDRAARLLANQLGAHALLLVTAVDQVMVDFGTPHQAPLGDITADEAARYLVEGQFPPGSMGPKVEAALRFLADGGEQVVITSAGLLAGTLTGTGARRGTRISPPARIIPSGLNGASARRADGTASGDGGQGGWSGAGRDGDGAGGAGAGRGGHIPHRGEGT